MIDHEKLKARRAGSRAGQGWKPRGGDNKIRILPPHSKFLSAWDELENLAIPYKMHFFRIEGRPTEVSLCLEERKQRCPACDMWRVHRKSPDPQLKELARQIAPADQYLFNMIDMSNIAQGIQRWGANWTCWDKIMEIAANADWGNVIDPEDGVTFTINLTPGDKSRTGFNQYSVTPAPNRGSVMKVLKTIDDWEAQLDSLEEQMSEPKEVNEIAGLLDEMGFPPPPVKPGRHKGATATEEAQTPPRRKASSKPTATSVSPKKEEPEDDGEDEQSESREVGVDVHYDPGEDYEPKLSDAQRPDGAPRCYGDYAPERHKCPPCPVLTECQLAMLEIDD